MTHTAPPPSRQEAIPVMTECCDRCGAPARLHLTLADGGGKLSFCGHHANEHADRIVDVASRILVEEGFVWKGLSSLC